MRLYLAGLYTGRYHKHSKTVLKMSDFERADYDRTDDMYCLESYHYLRKGGKAMGELERDGRRIFLDSGAFSDWTLGHKTDIDAYINFIKRFEGTIEIASVLDAIGDHSKTLDNQKYLEDKGCAVLPCFHFGEPYELLEYYVANYDYITIGGMVGKTQQQLQVWCDEIWGRFLCDEYGKAKIKVHGFGLTALPLMERYPWYSVDSSSWIQGAVFGIVLMPPIRRYLSVSSKRTDRKDWGKNISNVSEVEREYIGDYVRGRGYEISDLAESSLSRTTFNLGSFAEWCDNVLNTKSDTFVLEQPGLF